MAEEKREIASLSKAERKAVKAVPATSEQAKKTRTEVESWRDDKENNPYKTAMWHAFDEFYNKGMFPAHRVAKTTGSGTAISNPDPEQIHAMSADDFRNCCLSVQDELRDKAITDALGHEMTDDEIVEWGSRIVVAFREDIIFPDCGFDDDKLYHNINNFKPLTEEEIEERDRERQEAAAARQDDQSENVRQDTGDRDDSDRTQTSSRRRRDRSDNAATADENGQAAQQQQALAMPGQSGYMFTSPSQGMIPVQGSDEFSKNMSQMQFLMNLGAITSDQFKHYAIVSVVLDMAQRDGSSYTSMVATSNFLNEKNRGTWRSRKLAKEIQKLDEKHLEIMRDAKGLRDNVQKKLLNYASSRYSLNGDAGLGNSVLSDLRGRVEYHGRGEPAVQGPDQIPQERPGNNAPRRAPAESEEPVNRPPQRDVDTPDESEKNKRKPITAPKFLSWLPIFHRRDGVGRIQAELDEAIEENEDAHEAGEELDDADVYETFERVATEDREEGAAVPAKGFLPFLRGIGQSIGNRVRAAGEFIHDKLPFGKGHETEDNDEFWDDESLESEEPEASESPDDFDEPLLSESPDDFDEPSTEPSTEPSIEPSIEPSKGPDADEEDEDAVEYGPLDAGDDDEAVVAASPEPSPSPEPRVFSFLDLYSIPPSAPPAPAAPRASNFADLYSIPPSAAPPISDAADAVDSTTERLLKENAETLRKSGFTGTDLAQNAAKLTAAAAGEQPNPGREVPHANRDKLFALYAASEEPSAASDKDAGDDADNILP